MKPNNLETAIQTKRAEVEFLERTLQEAEEKGLSHLFKGTKMTVPAQKNTVRKQRGRFAYDRSTFAAIRTSLESFAQSHGAPFKVKEARKHLKKEGYNLKTSSVNNQLWGMANTQKTLKQLPNGTYSAR